MEASGQHHAPAALSSGKNPGTHLMEGCVGPTARLDGFGEQKKKSFALVDFEPPDHHVRS